MTKREIAGQLVGESGRYLPTGVNAKYHIRLNGKSFFAMDTAELADKVAESFSKDELLDLLVLGS